MPTITSFVANKSIHYNLLRLYLNQLGDDGIEDMIESLKAAPNLKQLRSIALYD